MNDIILASLSDKWSLKSCQEKEQESTYLLMPSKQPLKPDELILFVNASGVVLESVIEMQACIHSWF